MDYKNNVLLFTSNKGLSIIIGKNYFHEYFSKDLITNPELDWFKIKLDDNFRIDNDGHSKVVFGFNGVGKSTIFKCIKQLNNSEVEYLEYIELKDQIVKGKDNSKSNMDQEEYDKKYMELTKRYEQAKNHQEELIEARTNKKAQELNMKTFVANLSKAEDQIIAWNESIWMLLVKSAIVHRDKNITFKLNNGKEIRN